MRKIILLLFCTISFLSSAQVSIGSHSFVKKPKVNNKELERFLSTETIFILPNYCERDVYEKILQENWILTPYQLHFIDDLNIDNIFSDKYSFALLDAMKLTRYSKNGAVDYLYYYFTFFTFNIEQKMKEIEKYNEMPDKKKEKKDLLRGNRRTVASFFLFPKEELLRSGKLNIINSENHFHTFKPGFFKNFLQNIQKGIENKKPASYYDSYTTSELKNLKTQTLYVPEYATLKYMAYGNMTEHEIKEEKKEKLLSKYDYDYQLITDDELNQKILNGEDFYYLRYTRINSIKVINIVNAKTGNIVYCDRILGLAYNLKSKYFKEISNKIKKAK